MPARRFIDSLSHDSERAIRETTQPQGAGEADERADALIKTEEIDADGIKLDRECHAVLKMELCRGLVAHKVVSNAHPPPRPAGAGRQLGSLRDGPAPFRDRAGAEEVAEPMKKKVQTEEKAQL